MEKVTREERVVSLFGDGTIIWAKDYEIHSVNIVNLEACNKNSDGVKLPLVVQKFGPSWNVPNLHLQTLIWKFPRIQSSIYPQSLKHDPNAWFFVVCGDGKYNLYTARKGKLRSAGSALEVVWSSGGGLYAVKESPNEIKIFNRSHQEKMSFQPTFSAENIYGGSLLAICSKDFICFHNWAECSFVKRIDVNVTNIYWSRYRPLVAIASDSSFSIQTYNRDIQDLTVVSEVCERVRTGWWRYDCFVYNNSSLQLNIWLGGKVGTIYQLDCPMSILGDLRHRVYLVDNKFNVTGYTLNDELLNYLSYAMRGQIISFCRMMSAIPNEHRNSVARVLKSQGMTEDALNVSIDPDFRFELAIQLGKLEIAKDVAVVSQSESKWKQLGEKALSAGQLDLCEESLEHTKDLSGLLLLYTSLGDIRKIEKLASLAKANGKNDIAFSCLFILGKLEDCLKLLVDSNQIPEATLMALHYIPSKAADLIALWRKDFNKVNQKAAESSADPKQYPYMLKECQVTLEDEARTAETRHMSFLEDPLARSKWMNVKKALTEETYVVEKLDSEKSFKDSSEGSRLSSSSIFTKTVEEAPDVDISDIARPTEGYSGEDLMNVFEDTSLNGMLQANAKDKIAKGPTFRCDLEEVMKKLQPFFTTDIEMP